MDSWLPPPSQPPPFPPTSRDSLPPGLRVVETGARRSPLRLIGGFSRSAAIMSTQARALGRLKKLIFSLGSILLVFSTCGFVVMEVYIFTDVTESRLHFLDRTKGYRSDVFKSCLCLRDIFLVTNGTATGAASTVSTARSNMISFSQDLTTIHTENYVSPPTQTVTDFFLDNDLLEIVPTPGVGLRTVQTNFWVMTNDFISAIINAASIGFADLRNADYSLDAMTVDKRAVVYMCVHVCVFCRGCLGSHFQTFF